MNYDSLVVGNGNLVGYCSTVDILVVVDPIVIPEHVEDNVFAVAQTSNSVQLKTKAGKSKIGARKAKSNSVGNANSSYDISSAKSGSQSAFAVLSAIDEE
ncbi:hypothetical protein REPUB_Repub04eG0242200 [Reevesia pubescens]